MSNAEKIILLEEMMELESGVISEETILDELDQWDSLASISLIVLVDEKCGKKLTADEIRSFKTIADILNYMG